MARISLIEAAIRLLLIRVELGSPSNIVEFVRDDVTSPRTEDHHVLLIHADLIKNLSLRSISKVEGITNIGYLKPYLGVQAYWVILDDSPDDEPANVVEQRIRTLVAESLIA